MFSTAAERRTPVPSSLRHKPILSQRCWGSGSQLQRSRVPLTQDLCWGCPQPAGRGRHPTRRLYQPKITSVVAGQPCHKRPLPRAPSPRAADFPRMSNLREREGEQEKACAPKMRITVFLYPHLRSDIPLLLQCSVH